MAMGHSRRMYLKCAFEPFLGDKETDVSGINLK